MLCLPNNHESKSFLAGVSASQIWCSFCFHREYRFILVSDLSRRPRLHFVTKFTALRADLATRCLVTEIPRKSGNGADAWRVPLWWDLSSNDVLGLITNSFLRSFCELCSVEVSCSPLITGDSSSSLIVLHIPRIFFQISDLLRK